jgi:phosphomannomutase
MAPAAAFCPDIFRDRGVQYIAIRQELNPLFPGINPEPIEPHIALLQETVVKEKCDAGLATDGDADRIGAVAEDGSFVDSHKIFCVLLRWLLERKKWSGDVTRAFNTTRMLDRIAAKHGRKLYETQIGFKYAADLMMEHDILIGGEESGGIGYSRFLPERDGILNCLLLANVMAEEGKPLGQLVADLQREFGPHYYGGAICTFRKRSSRARFSGRGRKVPRAWVAIAYPRKRILMASSFFSMRQRMATERRRGFCFARQEPNPCCVPTRKPRRRSW